MLKAKYLYSLTILSIITLSGCSFEAKEADTKDERTVVDPTPGPKPVASDKGRLGLKMPKQGDRPYKTLRIYLEKNDCAYPVAYAEDSGMADGGSDDSADVGDEDKEEITAPGQDGAGVPPEEYEENDYDDKDDVEYDHSYQCSTQSVDQAFDYEEGSIVSIDDLIPGDYSIYVSLIDENGETIEEGYGWSYVAPGVVSQALVELMPTSGNGRLDLEILRAGDRVKYGHGYEEPVTMECGTDG